MSNERAEELIRKYLEGSATPEEEALLESWYIMAAQNQPDLAGEVDYPRIGEEILQPLRAEQAGQPIPRLPWLEPELPRQNQPTADQPQPELPTDQPQPERPRVKAPIRLWPRVAAAAAVLLVISIGSLYVFRKAPAPPVAQQPPPQKDILPASTAATLTLLDGHTLPLDSVGSGTLPQQGVATIRTSNGQLIYTVEQPGIQVGGVYYNTLTTRAGQHYSLVLPDGTRVWLNAASSISYPTVFDGKERRVDVKGEAYFEIVHNPKQPFRIAVGKEMVEDIGTHLNVNAYEDESAINTTLLEGSVKVSKGSASAILKPGQQATIRPDDHSFQLHHVDADKAIAWKNGYFYFDRADIQTVMRQLARWYNVQVVYKGEIPNKTFKGKVYRNINASEALQILSYFGAHFGIDGKKIMVTF